MEPKAVRVGHEQAQRVARLSIGRRKGEAVGPRDIDPLDAAARGDLLILPLIVHGSRNDAVGIGDIVGGDDCRAHRCFNHGRRRIVRRCGQDKRTGRNRVLVWPRREAQELVEREGAVRELEAFDIADAVDAIARRDQPDSRRHRNLGDGVKALRIWSRANGVVCEHVAIDRRVDIAVRDIEEDVAGDLAAGKDVAVGVTRQIDMKPGIAIDDVVACAALDTVAAIAAEHDVAGIEVHGARCEEACQPEDQVDILKHVENRGGAADANSSRVDNNRISAALQHVVEG